MNIVPLFLVGYATLLFGYKFLKKSVTSNFHPDDNNQTPAVELNDNKDFVPTRKGVLFGHHFMSIAGTSPIIASIVGLIWGWGPALLWMIFGVLLIGGVHDYYSLMLSVRHKGKSMGEVAKEEIGPWSGKMVSIVLAFGGILVYAIFLSIIASTLEKMPTAVLPTLALIPIAMLCGVMLKKGVSLLITTIVGISLTVVCVWYGISTPIEASKDFWSLFFLGYTFIAIYVPVWILLQPRDYLNFSILSIGLVIGFIGLIIGAPTIKMPFFHDFFSEIRGPLWPMLFVTISCGAASGWHALINSGTTSKQIKKESHAFPIAYGGMIGETVMAVLSASFVISAFSYADFSSKELTSGVISQLFSEGLGNAMAHLGIPVIVGVTAGALALSALTLTTLDSFARTSRYVVQELGHKTFLKGNFASSIFVAVVGFFLYYQVPFIELWNGLVLGGLMLLIIPFTILFVSHKGEKNFSYYIHIIFPLLFLIPTTVAGLVYLGYKYVMESKFISLGLIIFLAILLIVMIKEVVKKYNNNKEKLKPAEQSS
ncbi:MAG: carbon starvation protein A [Rhodothermaceae bacterium]